jgi:hypothetical protein
LTWQALAETKTCGNNETPCIKRIKAVQFYLCVTRQIIHNFYTLKKQIVILKGISELEPLGSASTVFVVVIVITHISRGIDINYQW